MTSKAERFFRSLYPHANLRDTGRKIGSYRVVAVYAGDYLCAEGLTAQDAFRRALEYANGGYISPDPNERRLEA